MIQCNFGIPQNPLFGTYFPDYSEIENYSKTPILVGNGPRNSYLESSLNYHLYFGLYKNFTQKVTFSTAKTANPNFLKMGFGPHKRGSSIHLYSLNGSNNKL